jgi:alpha-D-ribose 1-methylphosphonate 5-triphosphate synthase subunit PhnI
MGYTSVLDRTGAVDAAAALAARPTEPGTTAGAESLPVDQLMAEAGIVDERIAVLALGQARGDLARACSLVRAWAAVLPRLGTHRVGWEGLRTLRRITPGFAEPRGGQYLGASLDYAQRLLDLGSDRGPRAAAANGQATIPDQPAPTSFPRAIETLDGEGLVAPARPPAEALDITREPARREARGALLQLLSRAETGSLVAMAYAGIRGFSAQDPTLLELRSGMLPVRVRRPGGGDFQVGEIPAVLVEMGFYRLHQGREDPRLTLGVGATPGRLERRAIAAAVLDAGCTRAAADPPGPRSPCEDAEFLAIALDGQEASGFVEHLKLPHHVTFASDLDRVRAARERGSEEDER